MDDSVTSFPSPLKSLSLYERGKASLYTREGWDYKLISFRLIIPLFTREGLDNKLISFRLLPFGLRPLAVILNCAEFASLSRS